MGRTVALAWLAALAAIAGCSLLVDQSAAQCAVDGDCARFLGTQCIEGACASVSAGFDAAIDPNEPCTSTQDCLTLHGSNWVCRSAKCLALGSEDCGIVIGNYTADDVLLLGAILPIYGPHKSTGLPMERALDFAAEEDFAGGVPFGLAGVPRPVAVVLCDESQNPVRAAQHLAMDVGVSAIVGPAFGDSYLSVAQQVTVAGHVLLMSPYATADLPGLSADAGGDGLVWRTAPVSAGEGAAIADVVTSVLAPKLEGARGVSQVAVSVVWRQDADGTSLHQEVLSSLTQAGFPTASPSYYSEVAYPDSDAPGEQAAATVTGGDPLPDVVVVLGRTEGVTEIVQGIESVWPSTTRPYYVLSHGLQIEELLTLATTLPTLGARVLTASPGDDAQTNAALRELRGRYDALYSDYPSVTFGVSEAFDAYYALMYGLAAVRNTDVIGLDERDGLDRVLFGAGSSGTPATPTPVTVGPEGIGGAFAAIQDGGTIALEGTSGALAFDASSGTPASDVQVWCVTQAPGTNAPMFSPSGIAWSAATSALEGSLVSTCL